MAKQQDIAPSVQEINQAIHWLVQFYGSIISTPGVDESIQIAANKKLGILVELMDHDVTEVRTLKIAATGNIKLLS